MIKKTAGKKSGNDGLTCTNSILLGSIKGLTDETLRKVLARCSRHEFPRNAQIVREMDQDSNIYIVESGSVGVAQFSGAGKEVSFHQLEQGENFGEVSAIDGLPRSASVIALTDCVVTKMPFEVFKALIYSSIETCVAMMRQLTSIIRRLSGRVFEFSTLSVSNRIHAELLRIAAKFVGYDGIARIESLPVHAQIASRVSCNREAVSRELKKLENIGLLRKAGKRWQIHDFSRLQRMVHAACKL